MPDFPQLSGVSPILAFDVPKNNDTIQSLVWAFGVTIPPADPSASIEQHLDAGNLSLNLTKKLDESSIGSALASTTTIQSATLATTSALAPSQSFSTTAATTLSHTDGVLVAHAALSAAGFLILLPLGTLVARWARVFTPKWFTAHWFINVVLGIPLTCVGWALGPLAVARRGMGHIVTPHQVSFLAICPVRRVLLTPMTCTPLHDFSRMTRASVPPPLAGRSAVSFYLRCMSSKLRLGQSSICGVQRTGSTILRGMSCTSCSA